MRRDILLTIATRILKIAAGLGTAIITARALGDTGRGEYFLVITIAMAIMQLGNLGLHAGNTYDVARDPTLLSPLIANSVWLSIGVGTSLGLVTVAAASAFGWFSTASTNSLLVVVALAPAMLLILLCSNLLVGLSRIAAFNGFELGATILLVGGLGIAAMVGFDADGFLLMTTICWVAAAVALLAMLRSDVRGWSFRSSVFRVGIRYSFRAYLLALLGFLTLRGNVFVLDRIAGPDELGRYSVALQVVEVLVVLPSSVAMVMFPSLVREQDERWNRVARGMIPMAVAAAAACALAGLIARPAFEALFGPEFADAATMLWWMLPGVFCLSLASLVSQYLGAIGFPRTTIVVWLVAFVIVTVCGFLLTPAYGGGGAGASLSIGYLFLIVGLWLVGRHHHRRGDGAPLHTPDPGLSGGPV